MQRAQELGYHWLALSDHAPSIDSRYHLTVDKFFRRTEIAERVSARISIRVYHSIEADILKDGSVNIPPEIRDTLHFALVSLHHFHGDPPDRLLRRIDTAFGDDTVVGFAHPFFGLDQQKDRPFIMDILELAEKHGVAVEINLAPQYMTGNLFLLRAIAARKVRIMFSTDAHCRGALSLMRFASCFLAEIDRTKIDSTKVLNFQRAPF